MDSTTRIPPSEDGTRFTAAIVRPPAFTFADGLTTAGLGRPNLPLALRQHAAYCRALEQLGVRVTILPTDAAHPDSTFVEDTAVVTAHGAIVTRPGAPSRSGEVVSIRRTLEAMLGAPAAIIEPGTLDGGDVCQAGRRFLLGHSHRSNEEGVRQLREWLTGLGYDVDVIDTRGNDALLHLKSGIAWLGGADLVVVEALAMHPALTGFRPIVAPAAESYAVNCVRVNDAVLMADGYPVLAGRIAERGYRVVTLDASEFRKMDGGLSCLSLRVP